MEGVWANQHNGSGNICSDPKLLNEKILPKLEDVVDMIIYQFIKENDKIYLNNDIKLISGPIEVQEHDGGRCFTILTPAKIQKKKISIMRIHLFAHSKVALHTPKFIRGAKISQTNGISLMKKWDFSFKKITMNPISDQNRHSIYNLEYEIIDMLDYRGLSCISDPEYNVDECMDNEIHNVCTYLVVIIWLHK